MLVMMEKKQKQRFSLQPQNEKKKKSFCFIFIFIIIAVQWFENDYYDDQHHFSNSNCHSFISAL